MAQDEAKNGQNPDAVALAKKIAADRTGLTGTASWRQRVVAALTNVQTLADDGGLPHVTLSSPRNWVIPRLEQVDHSAHHG